MTAGTFRRRETVYPLNAAVLRLPTAGCLLCCALTAAGCGENRGSSAEPDTASPASTRAASVSIDSLQALGETIYASGEIDSARAVFEATLARARSVGDSVALARALTWLAQAAWRLGDYRETRRSAEEGLEIKLSHSYTEELFRSYNILGLLAWNESRPLDAVELFEKASAAAEAAGDSVNLAKVWNNLGLVATGLGDYEEARRGFTAARQTARALGEPLIEGRTLINLGMLDVEVGSPRAAITYLQESRPLLASAGDVVGEQVLLSHLGTAYAAIGDLGRAVAYLDSALQRSRENGLRQEEAINLEQLAELHRDAGNFQRALKLFAEARAINAEIGLSDELATDLRSEAHIHARLGNLRLALENGKEALRVHRQIDSPLQEISDLILLAELSHRAGDAEESEGYLREALGRADQIGARSARISVALGRARIAKHAGEPREVVQIVSGAEEDIATGGYGALWEAEALRAWGYAEVGALDSAAAAGQRAIAAVERVRRTFGSSAMRAAYLGEREAAYASHVSVLLRMGRVDDAFQVADGARGRALLERLLSIRRDGPVRDTVVRELASGELLLHRIDDLVDRLDEIDELPPDQHTDELASQAQRLHTQLERTRSEYAAALVRAQERDPRGAALLGGTRTERAEVSRVLQPDEALLEYLVMPERVLLFVLTRDTVQYFSTEISRDVLASRVRVARSMLGNPTSDSGMSSTALGRLYETLIGPAAEAGALYGVSRLIVVPHAELNYLPFAALRNEATALHLVEDYVITHLPSAASLPVLRNAPAAEAVVAATAVGLAPFPRELPATVAELEALERAVPDATVHRGPGATEARFRDALGSAGVVHAATHGILNARNPIFSRIEFAPGPARRSVGHRGASPSNPADDGRFEVHELIGLRVQSPLVFLSGCETGVGAAWSTGFARGDDYATLAQAFLYAGAGSVIATLWPVKDEGAAAFAARYYAELATRSLGESLALSQRAMIADPRYRAPYYWAAYRLSGLGERRLAAQESGRVSVKSTGSAKTLTGSLP